MAKNPMTGEDDVYAKFDTFFDKFCQKHEEVINSYECISNVDFFSNKNNISQILTTIKKSNWESVLYDALYRSIYYQHDIINEINNIIINLGEKKTNLQRYFDDVGFVYKKNQNDYDIKYCEENRDKLIEMNLKNVIAIAKKYSWSSLSIEELISAGNEGLCVAFNKYDPSRQKLKSQVLANLESIEKDVLSYDDVCCTLADLLSYGKLKDNFDETFAKSKKYKKIDIINWVQKNVKSAKFSSIAAMWINAYIIIELDKNSRLIKKPKKDILKEKSGESPHEVFYDLSEPWGSDGDRSLEECLNLTEEDMSELDIEEAQKMFVDTLQLLMEGVRLRNRRITLQRFGIGLPRPMSPKEISKREGISVARVSQVIQMTLKDMKNNAEKYKDKIDPKLLQQSLERCKNYM